MTKEHRKYLNEGKVFVPYKELHVLSLQNSLSVVMSYQKYLFQAAI